jgi:hypothetical protein
MLFTKKVRTDDGLESELLAAGKRPAIFRQGA